MKKLFTIRNKNVIILLITFIKSINIKKGGHLMKDKEHKCKILKDNLRRYKERRIKVIELELTQYELEYVHSLGYYTEVFLYEISTKRYYHIRDINSDLIKKVYYKNKNGIITFKTTLNSRQKKELDKYKVRYRPIKYRIYLSKQI